MRVAKDKADRVIGAIAGDIIGSVYEFDNHRSKDFPLFQDRCFATDDSIMTLAVAKALMEYIQGGLGIETEYMMQWLGAMYPDCGFGGRFYEWVFDENPKPYGSFGNGAAMRVSPVAYVAGSIDEVKQLSYDVTAVTHNHAEGLKGAEATAVAVWMALNEYSKDSIESKMRQYYKLDFTLDEIRDTYQFNETCQKTVPQAFECFIEGNGYEDTIRNAISIGGDSDTLAAIAGSIAGAYYGVPGEIDRKARSYLDVRLTGILDMFIEYCER